MFVASPSSYKHPWPLRGSGQQNDQEVNSPLGEVNVSLLADNVGEPPANTLDLSQSVHDLVLAVNVCVEQTVRQRRHVSNRRSGVL